MYYQYIPLHEKFNTYYNSKMNIYFTTTYSIVGKKREEQDDVLATSTPAVTDTRMHKSSTKAQNKSTKHIRPQASSKRHRKVESSKSRKFSSAAENTKTSTNCNVNIQEETSGSCNKSAPIDNGRTDSNQPRQKDEVHYHKTSYVSNHNGHETQNSSDTGTNALKYNRDYYLQHTTNTQNRCNSHHDQHRTERADETHALHNINHYTQNAHILISSGNSRRDLCPYCSTARNQQFTVDLSKHEQVTTLMSDEEDSDEDDEWGIDSDDDIHKVSKIRLTQNNH